MRPKVTVIIPVFNKEKYVSRAINSVLEQTCQDFELLVIDDASTDDSLAKVNEIADHRIKVLKRNRAGAGGYAARNLGVSRATGEWVAFLDADDVWISDHLERSLAIAREFPEISLISAGRLNQFEGKQKMDPFTERFVSEGCQILHFSDYMKYACKGMRAIQTNTILIKKGELFSHNIFPEGRTERSGDLYAWVRLMARMNKMVWAPHIAAISFRDVIGVSRSNTPSIELFRQMVDDLKPYVMHDDVKWLKKYANRMIKYAWVEKRKKRIPVSTAVISGSFFWFQDFFFCLKWTLLALLPFGLLESLKYGFFKSDGANMLERSRSYNKG